MKWLFLAGLLPALIDMFRESEWMNVSELKHISDSLTLRKCQTQTFTPNTLSFMTTLLLRRRQRISWNFLRLLLFTTFLSPSPNTLLILMDEKNFPTFSRPKHVWIWNTFSLMKIHEWKLHNFPFVTLRSLSRRFPTPSRAHFRPFSSTISTSTSMNPKGESILYSCGLSTSTPKKHKKFIHSSPTAHLSEWKIKFSDA